MDAKREFDLWARAGGAREDIFLSYAREDIAIAEKLADRFRRERWSVFWDTDIRSGANWRATLENKLQEAKCILVIWSKHSIGSEWVLEESDYGRARGVLVAVRIDDCRLPIGFRRFHVHDLSGWREEATPSGLAGVLSNVRTTIEVQDGTDDRGARVSELVSGEEIDQGLRLQQKRMQTEHISVSNDERDRDSLLAVLGDQPPEVEASIMSGYADLKAAQRAARFSLNERASAAHYASAAAHFRTALTIIGDCKMRTARDDRSVEYLLSMEWANCLVHSGRDPLSGSDSLNEAIDVYTKLSRDRRYSDDVAVHFRLGCALLRRSGTEENIMRAVRSFRKARKLATDEEPRDGSNDQLLREGRWIRAELARLLGYCNYLLTEVPGIPLGRRKRYFQEAVEESREAISMPSPAYDPGQLFGFTVLKAQGNLLYLLAQRVREGDGSPETTKDIGQLIAELKRPDKWDVAQNQVSIVDSIAFAAATIGDWQTAIDEAERNLQSFAFLAIPKGLEPDERVMEARAKEILFFARLQLSRR